MIIVDEEHENTYKQQDPAPRYHARNAAIVLAVCTAVRPYWVPPLPPSILISTLRRGNTVWASYLPATVIACLMPEIITVDVKELKRKKIMKDTLFSPLLVEKVREALTPGRAGDPIPEPPGIRPDDRVPRVRVGASLRELRR